MDTTNVEFGRGFIRKSWHSTTVLQYCTTVPLPNPSPLGSAHLVWGRTSRNHGLKIMSFAGMFKAKLHIRDALPLPYHYQIPTFAGVL